MTKAETERMWYLERAWGRDGWCGAIWGGIKKYDRMRDRLFEMACWKLVIAAICGA